MILTAKSLPQAARVLGRMPLLAFLSIAGCSGGEPGGRLEAEAAEPTAVMENVRFEGFRSGERDLGVFARSAEIQLDSREVALDRVRVEARGSEGEISIGADKGAVDLEKDSFRLIGKVEGHVGSGQRFQTSEVRYDSETQRIWTDREVRVVRDNLTLEGRGMDLDLEERRIQILNGVRTTLEGDDG